jgi:hypothetical protein
MRAGACIYDVRSHGYLDRKAIRISGYKTIATSCSTIKSKLGAEGGRPDPPRNADA